MPNGHAPGVKLSIDFFIVCVVHCLVAPVLMVLLPAALALLFDGEAFHVFLSAVVVPLSAATLLMGCRQHRTWRVVFVGCPGVVALALVALFGHHLPGEVGARVGAVIAASAIAAAHVWNYTLCLTQQSGHCDCVAEV